MGIIDVLRGTIASWRGDGSGPGGIETQYCSYTLAIIGPPNSRPER